MLGKITLFCKSLLTLTTLIWFLPCMSPHVSVMFTIIYKSFLTNYIGMFFFPEHFYLRGLCHKFSIGMVFPSMNHYMLVKILFSAKVSSHWLHENGFLPVWVLICRLSLLLSTKAFSQKTILTWFLQVWAIICWSRTPLFKKTSSQRQHWYGFSPVWLLICRSR